ncbi:MAG: phospholipase D family protein [Gammaproteobacteria bacterium]|nr:phospholipase D family protein [Gammaproteobacteria bacterium]
MEPATHPGCNGQLAHFGGPDRRPRALRDMLEEWVEGVPSGGEIDWVTYYFRDRALAEALRRAHRRGVRVRVAVDGRPRLARANEPVGGLLAHPTALGDGFKTLRPPSLVPGTRIRGRIHSKIYCFSHPVPTVFAGSFNPSGDSPEDPDVIARIGDQDRGYNFLVQITDPVLTQSLKQHVRRIYDHAEERFWRWHRHANRIIEHEGTRLYFYPRLNHRLLLEQLDTLSGGNRLRITMSHIKARSVLRSLRRASNRGVQISIITHDTERRAPRKVLSSLRAAGVETRRYRDTSRLPMHDKFMLLESTEEQRVYYGSLNLNLQSQLLNHEVLVSSENPALFEAFSSRWQEIHAKTSN